MSSNPSHPSPALLDDLWRERIRRAKLMTPAERLKACLQMTELAFQASLDGIRNQFPQFDEAQVREELDRRLRVVRRIEERGIAVELAEGEL